MAYTRQYTQGVGWENTPSINTPISAENLNQMDEAIQDVDAAVYTEFAAVNDAITQADVSSYHIVSTTAGTSEHAPRLNILISSPLRKMLILYSEINAEWSGQDSGAWELYNNNSVYIGLIRDYRENNGGAVPIWSLNYRENIQAGSVMILTRIPNTVNWALRAIIPAASSGSGCRIFSDHITEQSDTNLYTSTNVFDGTTSQEGDLLFLRCDVDAVWPGTPLLPGWGISFGHGSVEYGSIEDARLGERSVMPGFYDNISSGTTLIISKHGNNGWWLRAVIPVASGGGTHTDAINFKITSASNNTLVPVALQRIAEPLNNGDLVFLYMSVNGTFDSEASETSWQLQYKLTDSTTITGSIANGLGSPSVSIFNSNLPQGTWLVLKSGVYDSTTHTQGFTCIAKIDPASGGGTTVVANPTGTATDTLGKLQVGSTIYEIPGLDTAWAGKVTAVSGGNITPNNASFQFDPFTTGQFIILEIGVDAVKPGGVTSWSLQYTVDGNTVTRNIADKRDGNAYDPDFDDDLVFGSVIVLQYFGDNEFACVAVLNESGGGGASTLAGLSDTTISSPTAAQPLTYDATNSKWVNGGIIPAANGGTGNNTGYVQAGRKANTNIGTGATAEGLRTTASGNQSHAEGVDTVASHTSAHAEGSSTQATGVASHAEGGGGVVASGGSSHAEGASTQASGAYSHAEGQGAKAQASAAHAQNFQTTASANYSSAAGYYTTAGYQNQFVIGKYNDNKSTNIFEVGIGTANNAKANGLELDTSGNLKTAGTITDGNGNVLGQPVAVDGVWVISGETATLTVTTP